MESARLVAFGLDATMGAMADDPGRPIDPFAASNHLPWAEAPDRVRRWVEDRTGSAIVDARDLVGGFSPGPCAVLSLGDGRSVFVKAVGGELNPNAPEMHRREARVVAELPRSTRWPELLGSYDDGDWVALVYEVVAGTMPGHPWTESALEAVLEGLASLHEELTPCPVGGLETISTQFRWAFVGWHSLAGMATPPASLDEWTRRNLDRLARAEAVGVVAVDQGDTLVHGDIRSDNLLLTESSLVVVDWPHAAKGAPVFDVLAWAASVTLEGGPEPDELLDRYRLKAGLDPDAITAVIAALAGFFTYHGTLPVPPGLPTLRSFQEAQGAIARSWLRHRTGWP